MFGTLKTTLVSLLAASSLVAAAPGGDYGHPHEPKCTTKVWYYTTCGKIQTYYLSTKTIDVPYTTYSTGYKPEVIPCPTSKVVSTVKDYPVYVTKTYTTTYVKVETSDQKKTVYQTDYYTSYKTSSKPYVVTSTGHSQSYSVCTISKQIPFTSTLTTSTVSCYTKDGGHY